MTEVIFKSNFFDEEKSEYVKEPILGATLQIVEIKQFDDFEGKPNYLSITFEVGDCSDKSQIGKKVTDRFYLTEKGKWTTRSLAMGCGFIKYENNIPHLDKERFNITSIKDIYKIVNLLKNKICICDIELKKITTQKGDIMSIAKINKTSFVYKREEDLILNDDENIFNLDEELTNL